MAPTTAQPDDRTTPLGPVRDIRTDATGATLLTGSATLRLTALAPDLVRIRILRAGQHEPETSWAVAKTDWPPLDVRCAEGDGQFAVSAGGWSVVIGVSDAAFTVRAADGCPLLEGARVAWDGGRAILSWKQPGDRRCYGCGEKAGPLERRGPKMAFWNTDHYAYEPGDDPIYQSIPFTLAMDGARAHGLFLDNTFRQAWDLGEPGATEATVEIEDGAVDLYVFCGPSAKDVLARWTELTGRTPLPPLWTLGYHQCRWSYYPEATVRSIAENFRERRIPCDAIWLDIDYMERFKDFTWDRERFPDPKRLVGDLRAEGFRTVVMLDPGVKVEEGYSVYEELKAAGFTVKNPDGSDFVGPVWPGDCLFPDFTHPECRAWWRRQYQGLLDLGVAGFWNDMNEPAVFEAEGHTMPPDVVFSGDGFPGTHLRYHNVYGSAMVRASYEGLRALRPRERAFVLTRAAYAGAQRWAATWTGDNVASWEHLRLSIPMVLNLGLSGQGFSGPDIGGFAGDATPELFARWLQAAALFPFCRAHHAASGHAGVFALHGAGWQEPWSFGEDWEAINRSSIELRYRLLPYLYTVFEAMCRTGIPAMRPLFLEYPDDPRAHGLDDEYLVGGDLLCAPVLEQGASARAVYLPAGTWYDFWSHAAVRGPAEVTVEAPLERLPLFVRAGAILPTQPVIQSTDDSSRVPIEFLAFLDGGRAEGEVYEDDGQTMAFAAGAFRRTRVVAETDGGEVRWSISGTGSYASPRPAPRFTARGA